MRHFSSGPRFEARCRWLQGPATTEIDSAHLRRGRCLVADLAGSGPGGLPLTPTHGNDAGIDTAISRESGKRTGFSGRLARGCHRVHSAPATSPFQRRRPSWISLLGGVS